MGWTRIREGGEGGETVKEEEGREDEYGENGREEERRGGIDKGRVGKAKEERPGMRRGG